MIDINQIFLQTVDPHSIIWLGVCMLLTAICIGLLALAWWMRDEEDGRSYGAVSAAVILGIGTAFLYAHQGINPLKGVLGLGFLTIVVLKNMPRRRRSRRYS